MTKGDSITPSHCRIHSSTFLHFNITLLNILIPSGRRPVMVLDIGGTLQLVGVLEDSDGNPAFSVGKMVCFNSLSELLDWVRI